jgi:hypothetical protein
MDLESNTKNRIAKDIEEFKVNVKEVEDQKDKSRIVELAKMYASDAKSYLDKDDLYTAFSCISYAHGLIDALRELVKGQ